MNRLIKIIRSLYLRSLIKRDTKKYAQKMGVSIGKNNRFISPRHGMFGTEPYLISIGSNCLITAEVQFITHDGSAHLIRDVMPEADLFGTIKIGNNVFLGQRTIVLRGVEIGDNVVIGAGSIVSRSIPSNVVAAGIPAKVIKPIDEYKQKMLSEAKKTKHLNSEQKKRFLTEEYNLQSINKTERTDGK